MSYGFWIMFGVLMTATVMFWRQYTAEFIVKNSDKNDTGLPTVYWTIFGDFFRAIKLSRSINVKLPFGVYMHGISFSGLMLLIVFNSIFKWAQ